MKDTYVFLTNPGGSKCRSSKLYVLVTRAWRTGRAGAGRRPVLRSWSDWEAVRAKDRNLYFFTKQQRLVGREMK